MSLVLFALLSIAAAAVWAALSGALLWQAALFCVCCFLALNLLYVIFWVIVASTVDDTRPIEKQRGIYRHGCASVAAWLCAWAGVRMTVKGEELLPTEGRFVFVCNHRSMFDPIVTAARLRSCNLAFISKPSNLKLPYIGKLAYGAGFLPIDRENDRAALKTILTAADYLKRNLCSIAIYPEGTRSKGTEMLPFHAGSFKIAQRAGVPLVIACVRWTEQVHRNFPWRPTRVTLEILELLPVEQVKAMSTQELAAYSRARMEAALKEEAK